MIGLEQVLLLEQKVELAIAKIAELTEKNTSLNSKCKELEESNSLLAQRITSFEADQNKIEQGILHALDRLNSVENSVLKAGSEQKVQDVKPVLSTPTEISSTPASQNNVQETEEFEPEFDSDESEQVSSEPKNYDIF